MIPVNIHPTKRVVVGMIGGKVNVLIVMIELRGIIPAVMVAIVFVVLFYIFPIGIFPAAVIFGDMTFASVTCGLSIGMLYARHLMFGAMLLAAVLLVTTALGVRETCSAH